VFSFYLFIKVEEENKIKKIKVNCQFCGNQFVGKHSRASTCDTCRNPRPCTCGCGQILTTPGSKYCLKSRPTAKGPRKAPSKKNTTVTCKFCSKKFLALSSRASICSICKIPTPCVCGCGKMIKTPGSKHCLKSRPRTLGRTFTKKKKHKATCQYCSVSYLSAYVKAKTCDECK